MELTEGRQPRFTTSDARLWRIQPLDRRSEATAAGACSAWALATAAVRYFGRAGASLRNATGSVTLAPRDPDERFRSRGSLDLA